MTEHDVTGVSRETIFERERAPGMRCGDLCSDSRGLRRCDHWSLVLRRGACIRPSAHSSKSASV
jgi:hypothetical protein